jgi:phospholipid transport system substrate-binding protein
MLASSILLLLSPLAAAVPAEMPQAHSVVSQVRSARSQPRRASLPSPTLELKKSTEALRKMLARRHPGWSPEAEAQATSVQSIIDSLLDFEEIARRTLSGHWETVSHENRREFLANLQRLIERRPLDRGLRIDVDSSVAYRSESIVEDEATVSSIVTSFATAGHATRRAVDYRLCFRNGRWRLYDVIIDGVSMIDDYRSQFSRIIAQDSFDGLLRRMRKKLGDDPAN